MIASPTPSGRPLRQPASRPGMPKIRSLRDIEALESVPLEQRLPAINVYDAIRLGTAKHPDKPAMHFLPTGSVDDTPVTIPFRAMMGRINQTANLLHAFGIRTTDVVAYLLPLLPQTFMTLCGGEAAGIVCAVNPLLQPGQILEILKAAGVKVLVTLGPQSGTDLWEKVDLIRGQLPGLKATFQVGGRTDEARGIYSFDEHLAKQPAEGLVSGRVIRSDDTASYFHTGGTTGMPKLARHTHRMQVYQAWAMSTMFSLNDEDTLAVGLPLFHVTGAVMLCLAPMALGITVVVLSPSGYRNPAVIRDIWKISQRYRITLGGGIPTVISAVMNVPIGDADLSHVRYGSTGAAPLPTEVARAYQAKTGLTLVEGWGMTETTGLATMNPLDGEIRLGSVGLRLPYQPVKTVVTDERGAYVREAKVGEIGLVAVKGPGVFPGYVQPEFNENAFFPDGWLNTGDLGRFDADGYLWLTGRAKDLIIRGGHNIDPMVIEETLHSHPAVALAAAVGKPDGHAGELPVAYVQLKPGVQVTPTELLAHVRERIPERAAAPVEVFLVDTMPQTAVGKIFKPELRYDITRRVYAEKFAELKERGAGVAGLNAEVHVGPDGTHGTLATIQVSGIAAPADRTAFEQALHQALGGYAVPHRIEWR